MIHPDCYRVPLPYPEDRPRTQNLRLARQLFPLYTGNGGELSAISDYLYAALRLEESNPDLSNLFDALAQTEMHHLRLLGRTIRDLGGNPLIRTHVDSTPCSGSLPQNLPGLLNQFRHAEQITADNYRYLITQTDDEAVQNLLHRIILDEEKHAEVFDQLLRR